MRVGYAYPAVFRVPSNSAQSFGSAGAAPLLSVNRAASQATLSQSYRASVGPLDVRQQGLGGWTLDVHHIYDPRSGVLYQGDGGRRGAQQHDAISTTAGFCVPSLDTNINYYGDGGLAIDALLNRPSGMAFGPDGSLYIADRLNQRVRRIGPDGIITTVAGVMRQVLLATVAWPPLPDCMSQAMWRLGWMAACISLTWVIGASGGLRPMASSSTFAGGNTLVQDEGGPATSAWLIQPRGVAIGPEGNLYIADAGAHRIRRVGPNGIITTVAGNGSLSSSGDGSSANSAGIGTPNDVAVGPDGSLYIVDGRNNRVRRVAPSGLISTVAGGGTLIGDGGPATAAKLDLPNQIAIGRDGTLYIADWWHNRVRMVQPDGIITTVVGNGFISLMGERYPSDGGIALPSWKVLHYDPMVACSLRTHTIIASTVSAHPSTAPVIGIRHIPSHDGAEILSLIQPDAICARWMPSPTRRSMGSPHDSADRLAQITDRNGLSREASSMILAVRRSRSLGRMASAPSWRLIKWPSHSCDEPCRRILFGYTPEGLLTRLTNPRGGVHALPTMIRGGWRATLTQPGIHRACPQRRGRRRLYHHHHQRPGPRDDPARRDAARRPTAARENRPPTARRPPR